MHIARPNSSRITPDANDAHFILNPISMETPSIISRIVAETAMIFNKLPVMPKFNVLV